MQKKKFFKKGEKKLFRYWKGHGNKKGVWKLSFQVKSRLKGKIKVALFLIWKTFQQYFVLVIWITELGYCEFAAAVSSNLKNYLRLIQNKNGSLLQLSRIIRKARENIGWNRSNIYSQGDSVTPLSFISWHKNR